MTFLDAPMTLPVALYFGTLLLMATAGREHAVARGLGYVAWALTMYGALLVAK